MDAVSRRDNRVHWVITRMSLAVMSTPQLQLKLWSMKTWISYPATPKRASTMNWIQWRPVFPKDMFIPLSTFNPTTMCQALLPTRNYAKPGLPTCTKRFCWNLIDILLSLVTLLKDMSTPLSIRVQTTAVISADPFSSEQSVLWWSQPRRTGSLYSARAPSSPWKKRPSLLWLQPITVHSVQMKWGQPRWDEVIDMNAQ